MKHILSFCALRSVFLFNFRYKVPCIVFSLIIFNVGKVYGIQQDLIGAELFTSYLEKGKCKITLLKHYACNAPEQSGTEKVSIFEKEIQRLISVVELRKDTQYVSFDYAPISCNSGPPSCCKTIIYSAIADLGMANASFFVNWSFCCLDDRIHNLEPVLRQGFTLSVDLPNLSVDNPKTGTAYFPSMPFVNVCANVAAGFRFKIHKPDSTSQIALSFKGLQSLKAENSFFYPDGTHPVLSDMEMNPLYSGYILAGRGPFEKLKFKKGHDINGLPLGRKVFTLNTEQLELDIDKAEKGVYLLGLVLTESRKGNNVSTHEAFFILNVL